jgi:hypothetical protein
MSTALLRRSEKRGLQVQKEAAMPMIIRIVFLAFGLCGILGGVHIAIEGLLFYRGTVTPLGESRYFVGGVFVLLGIVSITIALRKGKDQKV